MRFIIMVAAVVGILGTSALPVPDWASPSGSVLVAAQQPATPGKVNVDIDVNRGAGDWWASPTWIAIGVLGVVLLFVIIAMIVRGGGTTIIRE